MSNGQLFGIGSVGVAVTVLIWILALYLESWLGIPTFSMGIVFRWALFGLFSADALITVLWSLITLSSTERGKRLVKTGPYRLIRHPFYSAIIWSGTGMVAMWFKSWTVVFSVIVVNLFWTWHIQRQERYMLEKFGEEYREYMGNTGQFFPRFK